MWPEQLVPGQVVERHTDPCRSGVKVKLPCCGRSIVLPVEEDAETAVVCHIDRLAYTAQLIPDADEGHWAVLTTTGPVVIAKRADYGQNRR